MYNIELGSPGEILNDANNLIFSVILKEIILEKKIFKLHDNLWVFFLCILMHFWRKLSAKL